MQFIMKIKELKGILRVPRLYQQYKKQYDVLQRLENLKENAIYKYREQNHLTEELLPTVPSCQLDDYEKDNLKNLEQYPDARIIHHKKPPLGHVTLVQLLRDFKQLPNVEAL